MTTTTISAEASSKKINSAIDKVAKSAHGHNDDIQDVILLVFEHALGVGQGDVTGMARLINKLPLNFDRTGIVKFVSKYSPIRLRKTDKTTYTASLVKENETNRAGESIYVAWNIDGARANKWYEVNAARMAKELADYTEQSFAKKVEMTIASLETMLNSTIEEESRDKDGNKVVTFKPRVASEHDKGMGRAFIAELKAVYSKYSKHMLEPVNDAGSKEMQKDQQEDVETRTGTNG